MSTRLTLILALCFALWTCSKEQEGGYAKGNPDDFRPAPASGPDSQIDMRVFSLLNLDAPGLEQVREYHLAGNEYGAAAALLDYYRNRGNVNNIFVDLLAPHVSEAQISMASQASREGGYRFYVRNYQEKEDAAGIPVYWSFIGKDGNIDWDFTPDGVTDKQWITQKHRLQWMLTQAKVYRATGEEKFFQAWKDVFGNWMQTYPCPAGSVTALQVEWYDLQPAERLRDLLSVFEYYKQSKNFTPEWLCTVLCSMNDHAENIRVNPYSTETSNHRIAQYKALMMAGILMPEFRQAGTWLEYGARGFSEGLLIQFNADGVQNELDPSYHTGVLDDFIQMYKLARYNGKADIFQNDYIAHLHNAARFVMDIVYPDYSIDNFNDTSSGVSFGERVTLRNLRTYSLLFPDDEQLLFASTKGAQGKAPEEKLHTYPITGYYMFRTGWTGQDLMLVLKNNYNPDNKWHCQFDNGTVSIWNNGRRFLPDAGSFTYGGSPETDALRAEYRSTKVHNTLMKEEECIAPGDMLGVFEGSGKGDGYEYVVTSNASYSDLSHRRAVFLVDNRFFVVLDEGFGSGSGFTVNISWHLCAGLDDVVINSDSAGSYGARTCFSDGNNMLFRTFTQTSLGYQATNSTSYYADAINTRTERRYYRVGVTKTGTEPVRFLTVVLPFGKESDLPQTISASFTGNQSVRVTVDGQNYDLTYNSTNK